jgi:DNA polymerase-3 subunit epsilon
MPVVLVFDTETTGLPERNASIMDVEKWPHILQLSYILFDSETKTLLELYDNLIKIPPSVIISPGSEAIHHITHDMCQDKGIFIKDALSAFNKALDQADVIVGHNISFDKRLIMVECKRLRMLQRFTVSGIQKPEYCTMKKSTDICKIEATSDNGEKYYKYPKLTDLHLHLFGEQPYGAHNALADILICLRCYLKLVSDYDFVKDDNNNELSLLYNQFRTLL